MEKITVNEDVGRQIEAQTGEKIPEFGTAEWEAYFDKHPEQLDKAEKSLEFPLSDPIDEERKRQNTKATRNGFLSFFFKRTREQDNKVVWSKKKLLGMLGVLGFLALGYFAINQFFPGPKKVEVEEVIEEEPVEVEIATNPVDDAMSAFDALDFNQNETEETETQTPTPEVQPEADPFAFTDTAPVASTSVDASEPAAVEPAPPANGLAQLTPRAPRQGVVSASEGRSVSGLNGQSVTASNGLALLQPRGPQLMNLSGHNAQASVSSSRTEDVSRDIGDDEFATTEAATFSGFEEAQDAPQGPEDISVQDNSSALAEPSATQTPAQEDFAQLQESTYQPGDTLLGTLEVGVVMVDQDNQEDSAESRVVVRGSDDSVWLGNVTLKRSGRVSIEFYSVVDEAGAQNVQAIALGPDNFAGVGAQFRETTPALASDLARGALRGVSDYVEGLNSRSDVSFRGLSPVVTSESAGLGESIGGSVSRLFTPPQGEAQQAIVRVAEVDPGTEMTIIVIE